MRRRVSGGFDQSGFWKESFTREISVEGKKGCSVGELCWVAQMFYQWWLWKEACMKDYLSIGESLFFLCVAILSFPYRLRGDPGVSACMALMVWMTSDAARDQNQPPPPRHTKKGISVGEQAGLGASCWVFGVGVFLRVSWIQWQGSLAPAPLTPRSRVAILRARRATSSQP